MKQIKNEEDLKGKTIVAYKNDNANAAFRLDFDDGTFAIFTTDYTGCYYEGERPTIKLED